MVAPYRSFYLVRKQFKDPQTSKAAQRQIRKTAGKNKFNTQGKLQIVDMDNYKGQFHWLSQNEINTAHKRMSNFNKGKSNPRTNTNYWMDMTHGLIFISAEIKRIRSQQKKRDQKMKQYMAQ